MLDVLIATGLFITGISMIFAAAQLSKLDKTLKKQKEKQDKPEDKRYIWRESKRTRARKDSLYLCEFLREQKILPRASGEGTEWQEAHSIGVS